jgi:hypothetical protein
MIRKHVVAVGLYSRDRNGDVVFQCSLPGFPLVRLRRRICFNGKMTRGRIYALWYGQISY